MYEPIILTHKLDVVTRISTRESDQFACFQDIGNTRSTQEDTMSFQRLRVKDLSPEGDAVLSSEKISERLWSTYFLLNMRKFPRGGSTATTTVYDGVGNFITATVGDSSIFAAIFNEETNEFIDVLRLNSVTHKPLNPSEMIRINQCGGLIHRGRLNGKLAISRAFGDDALRTSGVCAEPTIDKIHVNQILQRLKISVNPNKIKIWVIAVTDGFTDAAGQRQTKECHEDYLRAKLKKHNPSGRLSPLVTAEKLVQEAMRGSSDNITIAIQIVTLETSPFWISIFDGHGKTPAVSNYLADNAHLQFISQCLLKEEQYAAQLESVSKNQEKYYRDNGKQVANTPLSFMPEEHACHLHISSCSYGLMLDIINKDKKTEDEIKVEKPSNVPQTTLREPQVRVTHRVERESPPKRPAQKGVPNPGIVLKGLISPGQYVLLPKEIQNIIYKNPYVVRQLMQNCKMKDSHLIELTDTVLSDLCYHSNTIEYFVWNAGVSFDCILKLWASESNNDLRKLILNSKEMIAKLLTIHELSFEDLIELRAEGIENLLQKDAEEDASWVMLNSSGSVSVS